MKKSVKFLKNGIINYNKVTGVLNKELSWKTLKDEYIKLYMKTFNEEEMKVIIDFYKTSAGKKLLNKIPELIDGSMQIGEQKALDIMPQIVSEFKGTDSGQHDQQKKEIPRSEERRVGKECRTRWSPYH